MARVNALPSLLSHEFGTQPWFICDSLYFKFKDIIPIKLNKYSPRYSRIVDVEVDPTKYLRLENDPVVCVLMRFVSICVTGSVTRQFPKGLIPRHMKN